MESPLERSAIWYRERCIWPVEVVGDALVLPLGRGIVALDVPADRVPKMQKRLATNDIRTPALLVTKPGPRVVFLAEADEAVLGQYQMPVDVRFLSVPRALRLPLMHTGTSDDRKWLWAPDPVHRWLPPAGAVLAAVNAATPFSLRADTRVHRASRERVLIQ